MPPIFVTTVSRSYIPLARVLMESVARHHPDSRRVVLLTDTDLDLDFAETLRPKDLIPDPQELLIQETMYKPIEFATALKAKLLLWGLEQADEAFFLDPDMRVFRPMDTAIAALRSGTGTLLTPHRVTAPEFRDRVFYEWTFKAYGVYNTGFVAVGDAAKPFLEWWDSRLSRDCIDDLQGFEWVDQGMIDLAPGYFDVDVFKDRGYNVGWWNLVERPLRKEGDRWFAGDDELVLLHYSGVRPKAQGEIPLLAHSVKNRVVEDAGQVAALRELEDAYTADLLAAGFADWAHLPYGLRQTAGGRTLTEPLRRAYRRAVLDAERRGETPPEPDALSWNPASRLAYRVDLLQFPRALLADVSANPRGRRVVNRLRRRSRSAGRSA